VLAGVLGYAQELGILDSNPVASFRETLRRRSRTQRGRAESEAGRHVRPIEDPEELARLVKAAREENPRASVLVLLLLDAGLRMGEALGLTWGAISWGGDDLDTSRALHIFHTRPRGGSGGLTKSGRSRGVALSRRLRDALADYYASQFQPGPESLVLGTLDPASFRKRDWRRILKRARLESRSPKDLRDTYASWLLTAGVNVGYLSTQLGHADIGVTVRHYAKWCGGSEYRDPMYLEAGEVPADLLARLEDSHQTPTTVGNADRGSSVTDWDREGIGRVTGREVVGPPGFEPDPMGKSASNFRDLQDRFGASDKRATNGW
jgi:integrase